MAGIYLDFNATTPVDPRLVEAMLPWLTSGFGNPSRGHLWGADARQALERARRQVAQLLQVRPAEILFTSGGTESCNVALRGAACARRTRGGHIVASAVEHPAVLQTLEALAAEADYRFSLIPVDRNCLVDPADVLAACAPETVLVSVMHANNEVGSLQPIQEIGAALRGRGILFHTDAAQSLGKVPVSAASLGVDLLSLAGHKLHGPKGIGALYVREGVPLRPLLRGAGQEHGLRPGTEPVFLAVGLGEACRLAGERLAAGEEARQGRLRDALAGLLRGRFPEARIHAEGAPRLPNTLSLSLPGTAGPDLGAAAGCDLAFSAGAACHTETRELSHVLRAMHVPAEIGLGTIRLSLGHTTLEEQLPEAVELLARAVRDVLGRSGAP